MALFLLLQTRHYLSIFPCSAFSGMFLLPSLHWTGRRVAAPRITGPGPVPADFHSVPTATTSDSGALPPQPLGAPFSSRLSTVLLLYKAYSLLLLPSWHPRWERLRTICCNDSCLILRDCEVLENGFRAVHVLYSKGPARCVACGKHPGKLQLLQE